MLGSAEPTRCGWKRISEKKKSRRRYRSGYLQIRDAAPEEHLKPWHVWKITSVDVSGRPSFSTMLLRSNRFPFQPRTISTKPHRGGHPGLVVTSGNRFFHLLQSFSQHGFSVGCIHQLMGSCSTFHFGSSFHFGSTSRFISTQLALDLDREGTWKNQ